MSLNRLWITEKPDMARSLAAGLALTYGTRVVNQQTAREDGCLHLANGDAVGYFFGHMLELAPPEAYLTEAQNRGNAFDYLPLMPEVFKKLPKTERDKGGRPQTDRSGAPVASRQLMKMAALARRAREIVNAGDIDREGQLIVDEFLQYVQIDPRGSTKPIWRLALKNPTDEEIRTLINAGLERNSDPRWALRYEAASVRETGDWAIGMTGSRAYRQASGFWKMSVGRVTTPTLALVVKREIEIETFKSVQFYVPVLTLADGTRMRWLRREDAAGTPGFDTQGRIVDEAVARQVVAAVLGHNQGEISLAEAQRKYEAPPLPFDLGTLQSTAARRFGMTLKDVSSAAQALYERHKMITYIGTDCRFLPTSLLNEARGTLGALSRMFPRQANGANLALRSKAWNDEKTDEHFAIAPTGRIVEGLTTHEKNVFETVAKRFIAQFYPNHEFSSLRLQAMFGRDEFKAQEKVVTRNGWKDAEFDTDHGGTDAEEDVQADTDARRSRRGEKQ